MRILVAEDDKTSRNFLVRFLSGYGQVDAAKDGMEALEYFTESIKQNEPYDFLCLDVMMPKVDGLKVLKVIRTMEEDRDVPEEKHLPIIMMTALSDMEYVDQAFELGCDAYASKPLEIDKLEEVLESVGLI